MDDGLKKAIERAGNVTELARRLDITQSAVSQWRRVPAERCIAVQHHTGVPLYELRPDIYPVPSEGN